jgi:hypothetical protein
VAIVRFTVLDFEQFVLQTAIVGYWHPGESKFVDFTWKGGD